METNPLPWISALRNSHDRLRATIEPLDAEELAAPSYCSEWSIAQVASHLGSQAEIFGMWLDAGLNGQEPPGRDEFVPIWERWDAKSPQAQAADSLRVDEATLERFESLDADERARMRLHVFGMDLDTAGIARMRFSEHAVHTWDIAVALDPAATLAPDAVDLLTGTLGQLVARGGQPDGKQRRVRVLASDPDRSYILATGEAITLTPSEPGLPGNEPGLPELRLPAEAFLRLLYGRLDPAHTPPVRSTGTDLDDLRSLFQGF